MNNTLINRLLGVDDQAWHGLKETAGSSSEVRHQVGAVCLVLSPFFHIGISCVSMVAMVLFFWLIFQWHFLIENLFVESDSNLISVLENAVRRR